MLQLRLRKVCLLSSILGTEEKSFFKRHLYYGIVHYVNAAAFLCRKIKKNRGGRGEEEEGTQTPFVVGRGWHPRNKSGIRSIVERPGTTIIRGTFFMGFGPPYNARFELFFLMTLLSLSLSLSTARNTMF